MGWLMSHPVARHGGSTPAPARPRFASLLLVFSLCWPAAAAALVALNSAPAVPACCMRGSHHCHQPEAQKDDQSTGSASFQAVCRTCGFCHALTTTVAHLSRSAATRAGNSIEIVGTAEPFSQPTHPPSRLHASRAPPSAPLA